MSSGISVIIGLFLWNNSSTSTWFIIGIIVLALVNIYILGMLLGRMVVGQFSIIFHTIQAKLELKN